MTYGLSVRELECQHTELLPVREALGGINVNNQIGVNVALALNVLSDHSAAKAFAGQALINEQD